MARALERSLQRGVLDRLVKRLPAERQASARKRLRRLVRPALLGTLRWNAPVSRRFGYDRGNPVDRYYIDRFLHENRETIRGRVLEVLDAGYTRRFGTRVSRSDILDIDDQNPNATVVADLAAADRIEAATFDCFILTQTLQYVFDVRAALEHVHRILRPGGTVLCTVPVASRIGQRTLESEYWRLTPAACRVLFKQTFPKGEVQVHGRGNVLTCVAFLMGMAAEELAAEELETDDPFFPLVVTVRATKDGG
jgi:SAM-dependent methyltransferase